MATRFRYATVERPAGRAPATGVVEANRGPSLGPARDYWTGIVIGYLAAVLTSVGLMLAFMKHGW